MGNLRKVYYDTSEKQLVVRGEFSGSANTAEPVVPGGQDVTPLDLDDDLTGSAISVTNADVNPAAAIAYSKLAALTTGSILLGVANVATVTDIKTDGAILIGNGTTAAPQVFSGDVRIDNAGITSILTGAVVNLDVNDAAAIAYSKLAALTSANILVGSAANVATVTPVTGDISIDNTGLTAIGADKVTATMMHSNTAGQGLEQDTNGAMQLKLETDLSVLKSSLVLANDLKYLLNQHAADAAEHTAGADATNFPLTSPDAASLASLITLITEILTDYTAHDEDVDEVAPVFHSATSTLNALASIVAPATLKECITRLNDVKAKYNLHDADATSHGTGSLHQCGVTNADDDLAINTINPASMDMFYQVHFFDDFLGSAINLGGTGVWDDAHLTSSGASVTLVADGAAGLLSLAMDATSAAVVISVLDWNNQLNWDIDQDPIIEFRVQVNQSAAGAAETCFGMASDHNDDTDVITAGAWFKIVNLESSLAVVAESDDGVNNVDDIATGTTHTNTAFVTYKIDFTDKADVKFYVGGARVAATQKFNMANYSAGLQPYFKIQKATDVSTASIVLDYVKITADRY